MTIEPILVRYRIWKDSECEFGVETRLARGHVSPLGYLAVHPMDAITGLMGEDNLGRWGVTETYSGLSLGNGFTLREALHFRAKLDELWPTTWVGPDFLPICPPEIGDEVQELARHIKEGGIPSWDLMPKH